MIKGDFMGTASYRASSSSVRSYNRSEQMAYDNGFKAVYDASAYNLSLIHI